MHILDTKRFHEVLKEKGYRSIGEFAKSLGVHRNSIHYYLSGKGVFPEVIEKIFCELNLKPGDILVEESGGELELENIAPVIDKLHHEFPDVTFVLFGSRAKGTADKYSDWDIGVFAKKGVEHELYRKIVGLKDDLIEDLPFFVDIVNLNRADDYFLREASRHWLFLAGQLSDWIEIQRKAAA